MVMASWVGWKSGMNELSALKLFQRIWSGAVKSKGLTQNFVNEVLRRLLSEHPLTTTVGFWSGPKAKKYASSQSALLIAVSGGGAGG